MPVRNEERHLATSVKGVVGQDYPGELEILLCIGPSKDKTHQIAEALSAEYPVRIVENPTGRTPAAMNLGIAAASNEIIVRVDAHNELGPRYIETAVELLQETGAANVGGRMVAKGESPFEKAVAAGYNSRLGLGGGGFHLEDTPAGPQETVFLGAFQKEALLAVGGYDEWYTRAQDWELNYRLREAGYLIYYTPDMTVTYRPRSSVVALAKQFFRTGQWRREVIKNYPSTASRRYLAPPLAVLGIVVGIVGGLLGRATNQKWLRLGFGAPIGYFTLLSVGSAKMDLPPGVKLQLPFVLAVMHLSWGLGFLVGVRDQRPS